MVSNYDATQAYYLTFVLTNIDASSCSDSVSDVQVLQSGSWRSYDQYYYEDGIGDRYAWLYNSGDPTFSEMLPISVKITMSSSREISLWGIITDLVTSSTFASTVKSRCIYICS